MEACLSDKKRKKKVSVVQRWGDTVGGGRGGGEGHCFKWELKVEPGLEAVRGVSRHDLLRQTVPVWYSSREERHLSALCPAGGDVIAVVVALPRATSAACWSWQIAGADGDEAIVELEKHLQSGFPAALLKSWPFQGVHNGVDARCLAVSVWGPSCRSALDFLNGADFIFSVGIPDCGCIVKYRSNKGFVQFLLSSCCRS